jgi:hypothetical protein
MKKLITAVLFLGQFSLFFAQKDVNAKITIDENSNLQVTQYFKKTTKDTLQFAKEIALNSKAAKLIGSSSSRYNEYEIQNSDLLDFNLNIPQKPNAKSTVTADFFYTSQKYLALQKKGANTEKRFNLKIDSKKFKVIFPTEEDLKRPYFTVPSIVAGDFEKIDRNGFQIYYLKKDSLKKIERVSTSMHKSFEFYKSLFGEQRKPKVAFAPIYGPSITSENLIIFGKDKLQPQTISHEIAHIWFGSDGKVFRERPVTEAIAEFLSMQYLKQISNFGKEGFDALIKSKFYRIEGIKSLKELYDKNLDEKENFTLSYNLLPLFLYTMQNRNPNFINQFADFYKYKKDVNITSLDEMNFYFLTNKLEPVFTIPVFPDYFIEECGDSKVCITSTAKDNSDIELELTSDNDQKTIKKISFSKEGKQQILDTKDIKKITIDPEFKTLQITRLNDIWNRNDDNLLNKSRYSGIQQITPEFSEISKDIVEFLKDMNILDISKNIIIQEKEKSDFITFRKRLFESKKNKINGGFAIWSKKSNTLFISLSYYDQSSLDSNVVTLKLRLSDDRKTLRKLWIAEENDQE